MGPELRGWLACGIAWWLHLARRRPPRLLRQAKRASCGHTALASALGTSVKAIEAEARGRLEGLTIAQASRILRGRGHSGHPISGKHLATHWEIYRRRYGGIDLRGVGFLAADSREGRGHAELIFGGWRYDPGTGKGTRLRSRDLKQFAWIVFLDRPGA